MQAIRTRYFGPTNAKGSCIKAECDAGALSLPYDSGMNPAENHMHAARMLCKKLRWTKEEKEYAQMAYGVLSDGSYAHVFVLPCTLNFKGQ